MTSHRSAAVSSSPLDLNLETVLGSTSSPHTSCTKHPTATPARSRMLPAPASKIISSGCSRNDKKRLSLTHRVNDVPQQCCSLLVPIAPELRNCTRQHVQSARFMHAVLHCQPCWQAVCSCGGRLPQPASSNQNNIQTSTQRMLHAHSAPLLAALAGCALLSMQAPTTCRKRQPGHSSTNQTRAAAAAPLVCTRSAQLLHCLWYVTCYCYM
jgi:hypothetical protein